MAIALRRVTGERPRIVWHHETELDGLDLVVLPGGFSHGDYLRCGAMAARSPVMGAVRAFAARGGHVLGICNGFQISDRGRAAAGRAAAQRLACASCRRTAGCGWSAPTRLTPATTSAAQVFRAPMAHGDGNYFADDATLDRLEGEGLVAFRYDGGNPNGSARAIAGHLLAQSARARADAASGGPGRPAAWAARTGCRCSRAWPKRSRLDARRQPGAGPRVRAQRRGIRPRAGHHGPHPEPDRARHLQRDVVGALLLQIEPGLAQAAADHARPG